MTYEERLMAQQYADEEAAANATPAPRPTCETCPYLLDDGPNGRYCSFLPKYQIVSLRGTCGQHPDMAAWIKTEWPKVKR